MGIYEIALAVQFGDVDIHNRLTFKGALRLLQEAANCHSAEVGYGVNNIEKTGFSWVLYQQHCRLYKRPCWNTKLLIRTWSRGADGLICLRDFEAYDETGELVAEASTGWLLILASTGRMAKMPEGILAEYGTVGRAVFDEPLKRLKMLPGAPRVWNYEVQKRDMDINRHVNNLCYLDYALEALAPGRQEEDYDDVNIMYKKASYPGDRIACFAGEEMSDDKAAEKTAEGQHRTETPAFVAAVMDEEGQLLHAVVRLAKH